VKKVIVLNKKEGETPLESLEKFRRKNKEYNDLSMTYAGRLDPMAGGVLIVLVGDEIKKKEKYLNFKKEYEFEILFGFATDTYDILGKVVKNYKLQIKNYELTKKIEDNLKYFIGKFKQKYPLYSSKTVMGKQLFKYARSNEEVEVPEREVFVGSLKFNKIKTIKRKKFLENIEKRINKIKGDFRQKEILNIWKRNLSSGKKEKKFYIASFKIKCGSGTYIRGIANSFGDRVNIPALAYSIKRTKIGKFEIKDKNKKIR
jgi:tRNA pseudouridine55 synthase